MARQRWEYLSVRFDFVGRGITQEFNNLDINGERIKSWGSKDQRVVSTLPELLSAVGDDGWELVSHDWDRDPSTGTTWHYMHFKRPVEDTL